MAFVNMTGPLVKNAQVQRSIRNFVMRDYGKARRRGGKGKSVERPVEAAPEPAAPKLTVVASADPEYYNNVQLVKAARASRQAFVDHKEFQDSMQQSLTDEGGAVYPKDYPAATASGSSSVPSISRFSAGRIDPFIAYPIEMTPRVRRLVDHGQYCSDVRSSLMEQNP